MRKAFQKRSPILLFIILIFLFLGCAATQSGPGRADTYEEWLSQCKDYRDVAKWMEKNWDYDRHRAKYIVMMSKAGKLEDLYSPEETFKKRKGVCGDASIFKKHSLNRINPEYRAEIVFLDSGPNVLDHYVCAFYLDGKIWIMDYGVTFSSSQKGIWGPFENLENYVKTVYLVKSRHSSIEGYHFGWPERRKNCRW